jgi:hypothetical protein
MLPIGNVARDCQWRFINIVTATLTSLDGRALPHLLPASWIVDSQNVCCQNGPRFAFRSARQPSTWFTIHRLDAGQIHS